MRDPFPEPWETLGEKHSFWFYRMERPSFFWVNAGLPAAFFTGVALDSDGNPRVESLEIGVQGVVPLPGGFHLKLQERFWTKTYESGEGTRISSVRAGDVHGFLKKSLIGDAAKAFFVRAGVGFRLPTGRPPWRAPHPFLATGLGIGSFLSVLEIHWNFFGGFFLQQRLNYEQPFKAVFLRDGVFVGEGFFRWPASFSASHRLGWRFHARGERASVLFYEWTGRRVGALFWNGEPLVAADRFFSSGGGLSTRITGKTTFEIAVHWYPAEIGFFTEPRPRPAFGLLLTAGLSYRL